MSRRAFTIVEVLAALALLAILVTLLISAVATMTHRAAWVGERAARQRHAAVAIDRLSAALLTTMVEAPAAGAGVRGDDTSISVLTRIAPADAPPSDLARLDLRADRQARTLACAWAPEPGSDAEEHAIATGAVTRLRYHDGTAWRERFDSADAGRLPLAVEIAVWFQGEPEEGEAAEIPEREPDRRRVIAIPDAGGDA